MYIQGRKITKNEKLTYKSIIAGDVKVKAIMIWDHCCEISVTARKNTYYPLGYEFRVQEGNPWLTLR
jgi:hypothetical protein